MRRTYQFTRYKRVWSRRRGPAAYQPVEVVELIVERKQGETWGEAVDRAKAQAFRNPDDYALTGSGDDAGPAEVSDNRPRP